jgi:hypothetical protein
VFADSIIQIDCWDLVPGFIRTMFKRDREIIFPFAIAGVPGSSVIIGGPP